MNTEMRFLTTDAAVEPAASPEGWLSIGAAAHFLAADALHILTAVVGIPSEVPGDRVMVAIGRFRLEGGTILDQPVLLPALDWNALSSIETIVDLIAPAGGLLIREIEQTLRANGQP